MNFKKILLFSSVLILISNQIYSQEFSDGNISGNFQFEAQTYKADSIIGAPAVDEQLLSNAYLNLIYRTSKFEAGLRYENYLNPILGFDTRYKGQGISYRYATYNADFIDITVGDFYEQFGSGMIFRAYEERALGFDNAVDGIKIKARPSEGVEITGLIGKQRYFWNKGDGIIRGGNIDIMVNSLFENLLPESFGLTLGGSVVSRFQEDLDPKYKLPENVLAYSTRLGLTTSDLNLDIEYGYKYNDPNSGNKYNYNPGQGLIITSSYSGDGFGLVLSAHRLDNMDFRGDRNARGNELAVNFIPPLSKQHVYALAAVYPFATKPNGEAGVQAEMTFKLPKKTWLGGKWGTAVNINFSAVNSIDTTRTSQYRYDSPFFSVGDRLYFRDINIDLTRRITDDFKLGVTYLNMIYDKDIMENEGAPLFGKVYSNILILDGTFKINDEHSIRIEAQHLWSTQDSAIVENDNINGNWAHLLAEYTIAPNWFFSVYDQYNYGNAAEENQVHYLNGSIAYLTGSTRVQLSYGRQRGGIICVGGICRAVPASNGFYLSVSSSF